MIIAILIYGITVWYKRLLNKRLMKGSYMDPMPWTWFVPVVGFITLWFLFFEDVDWYETQLAKSLSKLDWWNRFFGDDWDN